MYEESLELRARKTLAKWLFALGVFASFFDPAALTTKHARIGSCTPGLMGSLRAPITVVR